MENDKKLLYALRDLNDICLSHYLTDGLGCRNCPLDRFRWDDGEEWHCFVADVVNSGALDTVTVHMDNIG